MPPKPDILVRFRQDLRLRGRGACALHSYLAHIPRLGI
jgi:hypothetical protein